jgi:hypothetical protein
MGVDRSTAHAFCVWLIPMRVTIAAILAVLFAFAPLICVRLCESRAELYRPAGGHAAHAAHAASVGHRHRHERHPSDASQTDAQHTWLGELQAMLRALVEFTLTGGVFVVLARVVLCDVSREPCYMQRAISPLLRPPRPVVA